MTMKVDYGPELPTISATVKFDVFYDILQKTDDEKYKVAVTLGPYTERREMSMGGRTMEVPAEYRNGIPEVVYLSAVEGMTYTAIINSRGKAEELIGWEELQKIANERFAPGQPNNKHPNPPKNTPDVIAELKEKLSRKLSEGRLKDIVSGLLYVHPTGESFDGEVWDVESDNDDPNADNGPVVCELRGVTDTALLIGTTQEERRTEGEFEMSGTTTGVTLVNPTTGLTESGSVEGEFIATRPAGTGPGPDEFRMEMSATVLVR